MPKFTCPVCGEGLFDLGKLLRCANGHSFDLAKQGYVNLLRSNRVSTKRHGDDRKMVQARTDFLEKGYYNCLRDAVCALALKFCGDSVDLLDVGAGEGWYTAAVRDALLDDGRFCHAAGIDISKDALIRAGKRGGLSLAVASVSALPLRDASCDLVLNLFAPNNDAEFFRILRPGGVLLRAVPLEEHLMGLKAAVYTKPYPNPPAEYSPDGFELLERAEIRDTLVLEDAADIQNLFLMTPYYYKTGREDQARLAALTRLETELAFCVFAHKKTS